MNSFHSARRRTWALLLNNGIVRARTLALAALNALFFINKRFSMHNRNCALRANLGARMLKAALTAVAYKNTLFGTAVARKLYNIDKRRLVHLFVYHTLLNAC